MSNDQRIPIPVQVGPSPSGDRSEAWYAEPGEPLDGIKDVLLVASGKGGVGKSTATVNLACALQQQGLNVGVLDADLYGPSVARMLGTTEELLRDGEGRTLPALGHGVYFVSVANVVPPEAALVWKGPLIAQTLVDMFRGVAWPELDVLLVDLPPGTGDVQLTILEQIPVSGAILVTTPQRLAQVDAERGIALFHDLDIPVFGVIENMSHYICPCCGERQPLFPNADVPAMAKRKHVSYLGGLPLDPHGQPLADSGRPMVVTDKDGAVASAFRDLADAVADGLARERRQSLRDADPSSRAAHAAFWERLMEE